MFLTHPNSHVVTVGMTVSLYCNVSGFVVSYVWESRKNDQDSWSRISNSNNYKYDVRQQSKQYRCVAGNDAGSVTSKAATIQMLSELFDFILYNNLSNLTDCRDHFSSKQQTKISWLNCYINLYIINIISCDIFMDS